MALLLQDKLDECASLHEVRAVHLTGAGKGFCAGQDLAEVTAPDGPDMEKILVEYYNPIVTRLRHAPRQNPWWRRRERGWRRLPARISPSAATSWWRRSRPLSYRLFQRSGWSPTAEGLISCPASSAGKKHQPCSCWAIRSLRPKRKEWG